MLGAHSLPELGAVPTVPGTLLVCTVTNQHDSRGRPVDTFITASQGDCASSTAVSPHGALPPGRQPERSSDVEIHHSCGWLQKACAGNYHGFCVSKYWLVQERQWDGEGDPPSRCSRWMSMSARLASTSISRHSRSGATCDNSCSRTTGLEEVEDNRPAKI